MRPSRGMGAIKKTKIPSATENKMPRAWLKNVVTTQTLLSLKKAVQ